MESAIVILSTLLIAVCLWLLFGEQISKLLIPEVKPTHEEDELPLCELGNGACTNRAIGEYLTGDDFQWLCARCRGWLWPNEKE